MNKLDYISEQAGYNNLALRLLGAKGFASLFLSAAAVLCLFRGARGEDRVLLALDDVREARSVFLEEERSAEGYAWLWGISAVACGAWAVHSPVRHGVIGAPQIAAAVGAVGLAGASLKSAERHSGFARTRSMLSTAIESADSGRVPMERGAAIETGAKLGDLRDSFAATAEGGMRTGCVVPALLCGVAVFGYSMGDGTGRDLAGVCFISALVIGGPAVINSWNINHKLGRLDSLILRWHESVKQQEETKTWKGK